MSFSPLPPKKALAAPLAAFPHLLSQDLDEVRQQGARVFCAHELHVVGKQQRLNTQLYYRPLRHIGLGRLSYGATVDIDPGALDNFYLLQWPLRGTETIHTSQALVQSSPATGSLINPGQRFHMRHAADSEKLFVRIDRQALERLASQWQPELEGMGLQFAPALPLSTPALASLRNMLDWLFREATDGALLEQPLLAAQLEETLLLTLLQVQPYQADRRAAALLSPTQSATAAAPAFVLRAEEYMATQAHEALTVSHIAQQAGVSTRSLYAGFQKHRGYSPMDYLRQLRLSRVHADLCHPASAHTSVTDVALRWGFGHMGQFSAAYKQRFGELPSHTLRRALA